MGLDTKHHTYIKVPEGYDPSNCLLKVDLQKNKILAESRVHNVKYGIFRDVTACPGCFENEADIYDNLSVVQVTRDNSTFWLSGKNIDVEKTAVMRPDLKVERNNTKMIY